LLEVLDPAQNHTFRDHYLEVDLDLSDVLFLATANMLETIPGPLLDRMEVIRLDGYTHDEKVAIARDHLFDRQRARNGLREGEVEVTDAAFGEIVEGYTREAGVRNLEREIGKVLRKAATAVAQGEPTPIRVDADDVARYLKRRRFHDEAADRTSVPGVATGLAVTGVGGDVLFVEATAMPGESGMTVTGQLGDGVGADRAVVRPVPGRRARHRPVAARGQAVPRPLPRRGDPQGRPVGRHHHDHGPGEPAARCERPLDGGDDRRGHAVRAGASHRRREAEGARRPPGGAA
jgi:ATP-dependent Lon protease